MANGLMTNSSLQSCALCFSEVSRNNTTGLLWPSQELQAAKQHFTRVQRLMFHSLFIDEQKGCVSDYDLWGTVNFKLVNYRYIVNYNYKL